MTTKTDINPDDLYEMYNEQWERAQKYEYAIQKAAAQLPEDSERALATLLAALPK